MYGEPVDRYPKTWRERLPRKLFSRLASRIVSSRLVSSRLLMLNLSTFRATLGNAIVPQQLIHRFQGRCQRAQKHFHSIRFQIKQAPSSAPPRPPQMPPKVVAEYAKSNRSSCKNCSKTIAANALRLGSVTRDSRGFDMTKWHHVDCFPIVSEPIDSADSIQGFSSLQVFFRFFFYFMTLGLGSRVLCT